MPACRSVKGDITEARQCCGFHCTSPIADHHNPLPQGWSLLKSTNASKAKALPDVTIPADGYLLVLFVDPSYGAALPTTGEGWASVEFHSHVKHLQLRRPDGSVASSTGAMPAQ